MYNQEDISELISKFLSGNASPEEAMQLEDWKNENTGNLREYIAFEKTYRALSKSESKHEINKESAWRKIKNQVESEGRIISINNKYNLYLQIAASIAFIFILGVLVNYYVNEKPSPEQIYATKKESLTIQLKDGSGIYVAENSRISVDKSFGKTNRTIRLNGTAKFNVEHQQELPFIVEAGDVFIKDIGTVFSVRNEEGDSVFVKVEEGVVLVFDNFGTEQLLKAGENAVYLRSKKQILNQSSLSGTVNRLNFEETPLSEVINRLNITYSTSIVLENPELENCSITTSFNDEDLDTILSIITETLGLKFEKTKNGYLIRGQKCQS